MEDETIDTPTSDTCQNCWQLGKKDSYYSELVDDYTFKCPVCGDLYIM